MHSVKEFGIIDNNIIKNIIDIVKEDKSDFQKSLLYSTKTQKNLLMKMKEHLNLNYLLIKHYLIILINL